MHLIAALTLSLVAGMGSSGHQPAKNLAAAASPWHLEQTAGRPARRPPTCTRSLGRVLSASSEAEIYTAHSDVYGCAFGSERIFTLGRSGLCVGASRVTIAAVSGRIAAFGLARCGVDTVSTQVVVERLSDGRRLLHTEASTKPALAEGEESLASIVVTPRGAVAWIAESGQVFRPDTRREVVEDSGGTERVLDSGSAIEPDSLRLSGTALSWRDGTRTRRARLP